MKWSWKLINIGGINIYVHATFLIIIVWIAIAYWTTEGTVTAVVAGVGFVLALFGCIVLHELGHALAARRYGINTRDITLLPIGGVARLERMPDKPWEELVVAVAGPLVNVVIASAIAFGLRLGGSPLSLAGLSITGGPFLARLMLVNVMLVLFNLLPAFPMDGGRILRALLATRIDYTQATQIAASIGQSMALIFAVLGLLTNPFLVLIAIFVWIGAAQEASMVQLKSAISGIPVSRAMVTDFHALAPTDSLQDAVDLTLAGAQKDFPVVEGDVIVGILTQQVLLEALARRGAATAVREVMEPPEHRADEQEPLETALRRIEECGCSILPVTRGQRLVGLLTVDNISEFLRVQAAVGEGRTHNHKSPPSGALDGSSPKLMGKSGGM